MRTAAFFGGSFNPPHLAHAAFVRALLARRLADEVWVVPCREHPFQKQLAPFSERLNLCRLAFGRIQGAVISDIEGELPAPSRTYDTLRELAARYPDLRFRLAAGADIIAEKEHWYRFSDIEREFEPLYLPREGWRAENEQLGEEPFLGEMSSREIRELLAAGKDAGAFLDPLVYRYILEKRLYGAG